MKVTFASKASRPVSFGVLPGNQEFTLYPNGPCTVYKKIETNYIICGSGMNAIDLASGTFVALSESRPVYLRNCEIVVEEL